MLVREAMGDPVDTCGLDVTVAQASKTMTDKDHGALSVMVHGSLIGIIEREIIRSVGLGNSPEPTTGGIEGAAGARSRNAHQAFVSIGHGCSSSTTPGTDEADSSSGVAALQPRGGSGQRSE